MEGSFWRRCRSAGALWMEVRQRLNRQALLCRPGGTSDVGGGRLANGGFEESEQRRIAAFEADRAAQAARPQAGRRGQRQFIGDTQLDFVEAKTRATRIIRLSRRYELEVDAMIEQQPEQAVARIFDGNRPLGTSNHLQQQHVVARLLAQPGRRTIRGTPR